jgi:hypothetical protein
MNQYIITEEELNLINDDFPITAMRIRSHPYQSERDILDELVKFLIIEYDDAAGFDDMKRMGILLMIINKMSQLRQQAGEP